MMDGGLESMESYYRRLTTGRIAFHCEVRTRTEGQVVISFDPSDASVRWRVGRRRLRRTQLTVSSDQYQIRAGHFTRLHVYGEHGAAGNRGSSFSVEHVTTRGMAPDHVRVRLLDDPSGTFIYESGSCIIDGEPVDASR